LYDAEDPELVAERARAGPPIEYNTTTGADADRRAELLTELFGSVRGKPHVEPPFRCEYGTTSTSARTFTRTSTACSSTCAGEFGENCRLGPGVHVYAATHPIDAVERVRGPEYGKPVTVGDDVWIGGRAVLNPV